MMEKYLCYIFVLSINHEYIQKYEYREQKEKHSIYYVAVMTDILIGSQAYGDCSMFRQFPHVQYSHYNKSFLHLGISL